jgi:hypothetical protein
MAGTIGRKYRLGSDNATLSLSQMPKNFEYTRRYLTWPASDERPGASLASVGNSCPGRIKRNLKAVLFASNAGRRVARQEG